MRLLCTVCGDPYETHAYRAAKSRWCSKACWSRRGKRLPCRQCGELFLPDPRGQDYCSKTCFGLAHRGSSHPMWKGDDTRALSQSRTAGAARRWRLAVVERDGHRCVVCGGTYDLHAHHVKPWATHPDLRFDLDSGETRCHGCHEDVHGRPIPTLVQRTSRTCL